MALGTVLSKFTFMHIFVTGRAGIECHPVELLKWLAVPLSDFMTFLAIRLYVSTSELEFRGFVIESFCRLEFLHRVAVQTVPLQRSLMRILMAGKTTRLHSQPSIPTGRDGFIPDEGRLMTFFAVEFPVRPFQPITGLIVIERFLIKFYHLEITTMMVAMTGDAALLPDIWLCMVSTVAVPKCLHLFVAIETLCIGHAFPDRMAFGAIGQPLISRMTGMKITRRYLSPGRKQVADHQHGDQQLKYVRESFQCFFTI